MSTNYVIYTDSASDIPAALMESWGVHSSDLTFRFDGSGVEYSNSGMPITEFYNKMREGGVAKTAAVNSEAFAVQFEALLKQGYDILYLGFSSGLSTTYNSARIAAEELREKYPERKIVTVDMLCASAGGALLIRTVLDKKEAGATIEEAAEFAEANKLKICHWFTVDDLVYLKRGGRISPAVAFVGNLIGIKPVLHVDNEGHLVSVSKVRGRRGSILALAERYGELHLEGDYRVFISHSDAEADANTLAAIIEEKYGKKTELITDVGPVIGAHSGPGTLALFFFGKER